MTKKPIPIAKNAMVNLNNVGLPILLNPLYVIMPHMVPSMNPTKFNINSNIISN